MSEFIVKIKTEGGELRQEKHEASDKFSLYRDLRRDGEHVVTVSEVKKGVSVNVRDILDYFRRIRSKDRISFAKNIGSMLEAGLPLSRILSVMERQTKNSKLKKLLESVGEDIASGKPLTDALKRFSNVFSPLFISMVRAGEEGGTLSESMKVLGSQLEKSYQLQKRIRGAMIYPTIVLTVMVVLGVMLLIFVVPTLVATFEDLNVELPFTTQVIIFVSEQLKNNTFVFGALLFLLVGGIFSVLRTKYGRNFFDFVILKLPIFGTLSREVNTARTARTLSSLLVSGVDYVVAVDITKDVLQNHYHRLVLEEARKKIEKGESISKVFFQYERYFPPFIAEMMAVGEETGKLSEMLQGVAVFYETEVEQKTKDLSTIIEPVLMVIIGIAVGFFAVSMISPTYSVLNNI